jgi:hypothetical protein
MKAVTQNLFDHWLFNVEGVDNDIKGVWMAFRESDMCCYMNDD